jgi:hypothetical protein
MLSNRELASIVWLVVGLPALLMWKPALRPTFRAVVSLFLSPNVLAPLLLFAAWVVGLVWVGAQAGLWDRTMVKDTLLWAVSGFSLFVALDKAAEEPHFFRNRLAQAFGLTAGLEFYLNFSTLDLSWELALQPTILLLGLVPIVSARDPSLQTVGRFANGALALIVIVLLVNTTGYLTSNATTIDVPATVRDVVLPGWLTLFAFPAVYLLGLYSSYGRAFGYMRTGGQDNQVPWRIKLALVSEFHFRLRALHAFVKRWPPELAAATSFRGARLAISGQQAELRAEEAAAKKAADDLIRYAGVKGTDDGGRQLDQREFAETAEALEWLHTLEFSWYRKHDARYSDDVLSQFTSAFDRHGLPENHGIMMRVSRSGQSWFAWRRTPSGWCFAIGAAGPPPTEWYFDGPEPPRGYPGSDQSWGDSQFEPGINWPD